MLRLFCQHALFIWVGMMPGLFMNIHFTSWKFWAFAGGMTILILARDWAIHKKIILLVRRRNE